MGSLVVSSGSGPITRAVSVPNYTGYTMLGWARLLSTAADNNYVLCGLNDSVGYLNACGIMRWGGSNTVRPYGGGFIGIEFDPQPPLDEWVCIAIAGDDSDSPTIYWWDAAGDLGGLTGAAGTPTTYAFANMAVGGRPYYDDGMHAGKYAYWKTWDAKLTQAELEAEMFSPTYVRTTNKNAGFADSAMDISGLGRNWTLGSGVTPDSDTPPMIFSSGAPKSLGLLLRGCG